MSFPAFSHIILHSLFCALALFKRAHGDNADTAGVPWSATAFGYDGPWNAVEVTIGSNGQKISLFPGAMNATILIPRDYCNYNTSLPCYAQAAGTYNMDGSDRKGSSGGIQYHAPASSFLDGLSIQGEEFSPWVSQVAFSNEIVPNVDLNLLGKAFAVYPGGDWFPLSAGCLGLGAPLLVNQTFSTELSGGKYPINASLIPGYLWDKKNIASNSFGMHIGSAVANAKIGGSLVFGGFDQHRVIGDIITTSGDINTPLKLVDISINVINGASPWGNSSAINGLLVLENSSRPPGGIDVSIDGCSPYLQLPKPTCAAIASTLPVVYNDKLGLYIWNTDDDKYRQIVTSPSVLNFTFIGSSNTDAVSICVPFLHLNLTLEQPLVSTPQQYFPCYAYPSAEEFTLGRAFLQDAFIGANWGQSTWWLAQAPGPKIAASPNIHTITETSTSIQAGTNNWEKSWSTYWTVLTAPPTTTSPSSTNETSGLPKDAQIRIGVGVGVGVGGTVVLSILAFFLWHRSHKRGNSPVLNQVHGYQVTEKPELPVTQPLDILPSSQSYLWEMDATQNPQELSDFQYLPQGVGSVDCNYGGFSHEVNNPSR